MDILRSGLVLPYGRPGITSEGLVTISQGDLTWPDDVAWIKLLVEHDQREVAGYAVDLVDTDAGLRGTFCFAGDVGAELVREIDSRLRDGLSPGIAFDDATKLRIRRNPGQSVRAAGRLREVSSVSVPAWEPARFDREAA